MAPRKMPAPNENRVRRGQGDSVALTVRLPKADSITLRKFAMDEGETLQSIAVRAFNRELIAKRAATIEGRKLSYAKVIH